MLDSCLCTAQVVTYYAAWSEHALKSQTKYISNASGEHHQYCTVNAQVTPMVSIHITLPVQLEQD